MLLAYDEIKRPLSLRDTNPINFSRAVNWPKELGVSRTPVMEALRRLSYEGFVEHIPDKGMFVTKVRFEDLLELCEN